MNLRDFVKQALIDIHGGIQDADNEIGGNVVNPPVDWQYREEVPSAGLIRIAGNEEAFAQFVEFDVSVTAETQLKGDGGAEVSILEIVKLGKTSVEATTTEKSNQIRFRVPMRIGSR